MPEEKNQPKKFSFNLSFGRKPPVDDATYQRLLEEATKDAQDSADGTGVASKADEVSVTFSDGKIRIRQGPPPEPGEETPRTPEQEREAEAWDRLSRIGTGAFPDTARAHQILRRIAVAVGLAIPIGMLVLGLATGQTQETVVFMTIGGAIVGVMLMTSFPG